MTAIWDKLSSKAQHLTTDFDEVQADRLRFVLKEIYEVINNHDEYRELNALIGYITPVNLLEKLNEITSEDFTKTSCDHAYHIIQALHDFDHIQINNHHTEHLIMKDKKRYYSTGQQMLLNITHDFWWKNEVDPNA